MNHLGAYINLSAIILSFQISHEKKINECNSKGSTDSLDAIDETFDFPTDNDNHKDNVHNEERQVKTKFHQPATGQLDVSDIIQVRL